MTTDKALASVIIPSRNRCSFLQSAVNSALVAEGVGEVIVVDDGSTDGTKERIASIRGPIRVVSGRFGSAAAARNVGATLAAYPYLAFLDSDDEMLSDKVPHLAKYFEDPQVALLHGAVQFIDERGMIDSGQTAAHAPLFRRAERIGTTYGALANRCLMFTSATLMRREAFAEVNGYDESLTGTNEDLDLYLRLAARWTLLYDSHEVARYRIWPGNFSPLAHSLGQIDVAEKHLTLVDHLCNEIERPLARYGLYRRLALSSQTLLRTHEVRRYAVAALAAFPSKGVKDSGLWRILASSFVPQPILRRRRGD